jgi:hypothetical protein
MPLDETLTADFAPEVRDAPSLQQINDLPSLAKGYVEAQSYIGRSIQLPGKDVQPEKYDDWAKEQSKKLEAQGYEIKKRVSLPDSPDNYKIDWPEGMEINKDFEQTFRGIAHQQGIPNEALQMLASAYTDYVNDVMAKVMVPDDIADAELKKIAGAEYESAMKEVTAGLDEIKGAYEGYEERTKGMIIEERLPDGSIKRYSFNSHPIIKGLQQIIGGLSAEDHSTDTGRLNGAPSNQQSLINEAQDIINNPDNPRHQLYVRGDKATHEYLQHLFSQAYPGDRQI